MSFYIENKAKINLLLEIMVKREDGYHEIKSIMQTLSLKDNIKLEQQPSGVTIITDNLEVPVDETNTISKAYKLMAHYAKTKAGIKVTLEKNIPVAAGLAGGSGNGAATLIALNELWGLELKYEELLQMSKHIGADVSYCLKGGTQLATGIGHELKSLKPLKDHTVLLINPRFPISTQEAYSIIKLNQKKLSLQMMLKGIEDNNLNLIARALANHMEKAIFERYPVIESIKASLAKSGSLGALMSGSGATVFALFEDREMAEYVKKKQPEEYFSYLAKME